MDNYYVCNGGTKLLYEHIKGAEFNTIEIWIMFGSAQDPKGKVGAAHFIEHLLLPEQLSNIDLYAYKNAYATTSKERIRLYTNVKKEKTSDILECLLDNIVNLNSSEYNFQYERLKVLQEILYLKKTPTVLYIEEAEKELFKDTGYSNLTVGEESAVKSMDMNFVKTHLSKRVKENGIIISIAGEVDIDSIKKIIDKNINEPLEKEKVLCIDGFKPRVIFSNLNLSGNLNLYNTKRQDVDLDSNYILDSLLEEFISYRFRKDFISVKKIDYNFYKFITLYISKANNRKDLINEIYHILSSPIDENMFNMVKTYVYEKYLHMGFNCEEMAYYNASKVFSDRKYNIKKFLQELNSIDGETFTTHLSSVLKEEKAITVTAKNKF